MYDKILLPLTTKLTSKKSRGKEGLNMHNDRITEVLGIKGFFVKDIEVGKNKLIIDLAREKEIYCCSNCGQEHFFYYDSREQEVRDLDMSENTVYLRFDRHRIICNCQKKPKVMVERLNFIDIHRRMTKRFEEYVYGLSLKMTISDVSKETNINWHSIREIEKRYIKKMRHGIKWKKISRLAIDEVSWNGKMDYITIVTDRDGQGVVWIGDGRARETLNKFFEYVGEDRYKRFEMFTIDMSKHYTASIKTYCPNAKIVYDLFHIMRNLNEKINKVRAEEMNKGRKKGKTYHRNDKWLLLKSKQKLTKGEEIDLKKLLEENINIQKGYLLKEMLREIFKERRESIEKLKERIGYWVEAAWNTNLKPLQDFCETIARHFKGIVNYLRYHVTNSMAEGINNVIKRLFRMAYGYRDKEYFKLKIIQQCSFIADSGPL